MCKTLKIARSTLYYKEKPRTVDAKLENAVIKEFYGNRKVFGRRKLKVVLANQNIRISEPKISKIMKKYSMVSKYTIRNAKKRKEELNADITGNIVNRKFNGRGKYEVVVSDLTYIKIGGIWSYLCLLLDLCGRKIIGSAIGNKRDAKLVESAFHNTEIDLRNINIFHTDRGSEFKNLVIEQILEAFEIERSLSAKGAPYDNAVAEAMYSIIKTEFVFGENYDNISHFKREWFDYANWYNNRRPHGSLDYLTPCEWHDLS